ncbi:hypothetical protein [Micromonospora sp. NBC_00421]|uniref:hypothetical protein n=1 Tax=Micromonospora sp. NBC_00421 TaxID=2975976 RepID=UPI002E229EAE
MCNNTSRTDQDSQEITRLTNRHKEILDLRAKRQRVGHTAYGLIALGLTIGAAFMWGLVFHDAHMDPAAQSTRGYQAFLAFALLAGVAAAGCVRTWMMVRVIQRHTADHDRIHAYDEEQQVKRVAEAVYARFVKAEKAAQQTRWEKKADNIEQALAATNGRAPRPRQGTAPSSDPSPVIRLPQARQSHRYS